MHSMHSTPQQQQQVCHASTPLPSRRRMLTAYVDHRSIDRPHKRLAIRNNTITAAESASLPHPSVTISSTSPTTPTEQDVSPPHSSLDAAPDGGFAISGTSSVDEVSIATPIENEGRKPSQVSRSSSAGARNSDARVYGDTFIASITTLARPPLTAPPVLASQASSASLAFPAFSLGTTNNNVTTTTRGWYTNSSTAAFPTRMTGVPPTTTDGFCTATSDYGSFVTIIEYSIIHTWTITWLGNPADYTPPFPTISTPRPCAPTASATGRFTISVCDSSGQSCSLVHTTTGDPAASSTTEPWWVWVSDTSAIRGMQPTLTFVTTDKNPAVVFPTSLPPDYGGPPDPMGNVHSAAYPNEVQSPAPPDYGSGVTTDQNVRSRPITDPPPVTVVVKPGVVIIDGQTFTNNPAQPTSTVVVDENTFTINPTQVIGAGATVTRPPTSRITSAPSPTKTTIGHIGVDIEGSSVVIDKTTFTIGPRPTTVIVQGQTITVGPGAIVFPGETLAIPAPPGTTRVAFGAELITAIGSDKVVIEGRTLTYGPGSGTVTEVIDGDTILIGPSGVVAHGTTYGGPGAASTAVQFAAVGGVTISQVGPTLVVVQGVTHTLDPLAATPQPETTTVLGGETVTIGPRGVAIDTWTLDSPYASTTVITPSNGAAVALPTATAAGANKENDGPSWASRRPSWALTICIAMGAGVVGAQLP
ncbi:hypothetical protein SAMD00023353_0101110 [Rosellinia necatrix]|uniref:Uncharacterized protein n=1 Tax=Rosellinia necatrix TaxID=77044 RepID=A0A1S7UHE6_ROSNE|nr:hypothetical protein SAMD00023353_0101110 [Rosellinia necatrix]